MYLFDFLFTYYFPSSSSKKSNVDFPKQESSEIRAVRWKWLEQKPPTSKQEKEEREKEEKEASAPQENQEETRAVR